MALKQLPMCQALTVECICQVYKVAIVRGTRQALVAAGRTRILKTESNT